MIVPRPLRAPRENLSLFADPPLREWPALVDANRRRFERSALPILGKPLVDLRSMARREALDAARHYLTAAGEPRPESSGDALILAGHQPELFHPGVWIKNFAVGYLGRRVAASALNLLVDSDAVKNTALALPELTDGRTESARLAKIAFDHGGGEFPYEEYRVRDEVLFESVPARAAAICQTWGFDPLLGSFWREAERQARRTPLLGERFSAARRAVERRWGVQNPELPLSHLCRTEAFGWFALHILADLPHFHAVYNTAVQEYRRHHGIKSRNHPVPDLQRDGDWLEAPFWTWHPGQPRRGRLLARTVRGQIELRAENEAVGDLPAIQSSSASIPEGLLVLQRMEEQGIKVRTRALTTTLFARLFLADLFVHGIGGGKYDELTDEIIRQFYRCAPPGYAVLSATIWLPFAARPCTTAEIRRLSHSLRDLAWNPQRHLDDGSLAQEGIRKLVEARQAEVTRMPASSADKRRRFERLRALTAELRPHGYERAEFLRKSLESCRHDVDVNAILQRRDYACWLYPEEPLRKFFDQCLAELASD